MNMSIAHERYLAEVQGVVNHRALREHRAEFDLLAGAGELPYPMGAALEELDSPFGSEESPLPEEVIRRPLPNPLASDETPLDAPALGAPPVFKLDLNAVA